MNLIEEICIVVESCIFSCLHPVLLGFKCQESHCNCALTVTDVGHKLSEVSSVAVLWHPGGGQSLSWMPGAANRPFIFGSAPIYF